MRSLLALALLSPLVLADAADDYFELGLDYLSKGFYARARAAFAESLVRAPGEPVPLVFLGVAAAAEGRSAALCARLLRLGYERLPEDRTLLLDLRRQLPSARALALIHSGLARRLPSARGPARLDLLTVLAFLEVHDGDPDDAPALEELRKLAPRDPFALALRPRRAAA